MQTFKGVLLAFPGQSFLLLPSFPLSRVSLCLPAPRLQHSSAAHLLGAQSPQASPPGRSTAALGVHGCGVGMGGLFLSLSFSIFLCLTSKAQGKHWYRRKPCPQVRWSLPCSDEQISRSSVSLVCSYGPPTTTAAGLCLSRAELL